MHWERVVFCVFGCGLLVAAPSGASATPPAKAPITDASASPRGDARPNAKPVLSARAADATPATSVTYGAGKSIVFSSGPDWESFGGPDAKDVGPAQEVCVNASVPMDCPSGALRYRHTFGQGWTAFNGLPNVHWIWLATVAQSQRADNVQAQFAKSFTLGDNPRGRIAVAADDFAVVYVNRMLVGAVGSTSAVSVAANGQNNAASFDLTPALRAGDNTITIVAQNGPASFAGCPKECTYNENPAGVAFTGTLSW